MLEGCTHILKIYIALQGSKMLRPLCRSSPRIDPQRMCPSVSMSHVHSSRPGAWSTAKAGTRWRRRRANAFADSKAYAQRSLNLLRVSMISVISPATSVKWIYLRLHVFGLTLLNSAEVLNLFVFKSCRCRGQHKLIIMFCFL